MSHNRRKHGQDAGFTLLEMMIAAGIMVGGLVLVFASIFSMNELCTLSGERALGMAQLSGLLEDLRASSYDELLTYQPPPINVKLGSPVVEVQAYYDDGSYVYLPIEGDVLDPPLPNPCELNVKLSWSDRRNHIVTATASTMYRR